MKLWNIEATFSLPTYCILFLTCQRLCGAGGKPKPIVFFYFIFSSKKLDQGINVVVQATVASGMMLTTVKAYL